MRFSSLKWTGSSSNVSFMLLHCKLARNPHCVYLTLRDYEDTYVITSVILGAILIYPQRNIRFIDALFLASGATTQSGLNT